MDYRDDISEACEQDFWRCQKAMGTPSIVTSVMATCCFGGILMKMAEKVSEICGRRMALGSQEKALQQQLFGG
eukprot:s2476_g14.t1